MALTSKLFQGDSRLATCQLDDTAHVTPGSVGDHVAKIQTALNRLGSIPIDPKELSEKRYGSSTTNAVLAYKTAHRILNYANQIDNIVGKKTITSLDLLVAEWEKKNLRPTPPVPPLTFDAGVQINAELRIVPEYYEKCGLETIGPGQLRTGNPRTFSTLEELIDVLQTRTELHQVIVNHGDPERGLLVRCCKETNYKDTGKIIYLLSGLADRVQQKGAIDPTNPIDKVMLDGAAKDMHVAQAVVIRLANKLVAVRKKRFCIHLRACNLRDAPMLLAYKKAFGALLISFHSCRLLYVIIDPQQLAPPNTVASVLAQHVSGPQKRYRGFEDPIGLVSPMLIGINDIDGHTRIGDYTLMEHKTTNDIKGWAEILIRRWNESNPSRFVLPVMWENSDTTFYSPLEPGFASKIQLL